MNNAGVADYARVDAMPMTMFDTTIEHYLRIPFALSQAAIPLMRARRRLDRERRFGHGACAAAAVRRFLARGRRDRLCGGQGRAVALHARARGRARSRRHRGEPGRAEHRDPHAGRGPLHPRRLSDRGRRVSRGNRARAVQPAGKRAHGPRRAQPAFPAVAGARGALARRPLAVAAARDSRVRASAHRPDRTLT
ncbi:hypothetical protein BDI4_450066 [Burkholderia diffusa]|nr:hypothetical protein BDI4_450066 [Burkholderia diffusa]